MAIKQPAQNVRAAERSIHAQPALRIRLDVHGQPSDDLERVIARVRADLAQAIVFGQLADMCGSGQGSIWVQDLDEVVARMAPGELFVKCEIA